MKRAVLLVKASPHYRRDAFETGLKRIGYTVVRSIDSPGPGDLLLSWNLFGGAEKLADGYRKRGAKVIVAENGYLTPPGKPGMYALSCWGHNGAGTFPAPADDSRWRALGIEAKPWRRDGRHILVAAQRGIGSRDMASPHGWHQKTAQKLRALTRRPVVIRPHPGCRTQGIRPLEADLRDAWAVVIWSSAVGVHSLVAGVPVFFAAPHWICESAALRAFSLAAAIESPLRDDGLRAASLARMAGGQWDYQEIATGEPLKGLLECS